MIRNVKEPVGAAGVAYIARHLLARGVGRGRDQGRNINNRERVDGKTAARGINHLKLRNQIARAKGVRMSERNCCARGCCGRLKKSSGVAVSRMLPASMKKTRSATSWANPISWLTHTMVMPSRARS